MQEAWGALWRNPHPEHPQTRLKSEYQALRSEDGREEKGCGISSLHDSLIPLGYLQTRHSSARGWGWGQAQRASRLRPPPKVKFAWAPGPQPGSCLGMGKGATSRWDRSVGHQGCAGAIGR